MEKPKITENIEESYNELKSELKEKYADKIKISLEQVKDEMISKRLSSLGSDVLPLFEEAVALEKDIDEERKEFLGSDEYKEAQKKLANLKEDLANCISEEDKKEIDGNMLKAISDITTLNVTINNRLKDKNEKLAEKNKKLEEFAEKNKDELAALKNDVINAVKKTVSENLECFNEELSELNEAFGLAFTPELPFDEDIIKLKIPFFNSKFLGSTKKTDGKTIIVSENKNTAKN